ncbi:MAG: right-handed parallel beta-helix repeat-containing protein [Chloroflexota bacterium]|nr:right-handed parallel beta-helix repeat-containing protein [Chloroflexota bacterium]
MTRLSLSLGRAPLARAEHFEAQSTSRYLWLALVLVITMASVVGASLASVAEAAGGANPRKGTDTTAPQTTITAGPATPTTSTSASISFGSTEPGSFECMLDAGNFEACTSPKEYTALAFGDHTYQVRARDTAGNLDATPASTTWQIIDANVCAIDPPDGQVAIAEAIRACPDGSTVRFPPARVYTQTASILVADRSDLIIDGNGSMFRSIVPTSYDSPDPKPQWRVKSGHNVTIQSMTIVGNFYPTSRAKYAGNQLDHGVEIKGGDDITVRDNTFRNVFGDAVTTVRSESMRGNAAGGVASENVRVLRNTITTMARHCVSFTELIGGSIEDNSLSDCHYGGIDLEINFAGQKMQDIKVLRNQLHGYTVAGIAVEGAVSSTQVSALGDMARIEVRGNTVGAGDTCWPPILFSEKDNDRGPISDVIVADNTVSTPSYGIGIFDVIGGSVTGNHITLTRSKTYCASTLTTVTPVWQKRSSDVVVSGNTSTSY